MGSSLVVVRLEITTHGFKPWQWHWLDSSPGFAPELEPTCRAKSGQGEGGGFGNRDCLKTRNISAN